MAATKDFIVTSMGEEGYVEVKETDTLIQVRSLILDEFDEDQLPAREFTFKMNGIRISSKQEGRKLAFELLSKQAKVELVPKIVLKRKADLPLEEPDSLKRAKTSSLVTPTEGTRKEKDEQEQQIHQNGLLYKPSPLVLDQMLSDENDNNQDHTDDNVNISDNFSDEINIESTTVEKHNSYTLTTPSKDNAEYGGNQVESDILVSSAVSPYDREKDQPDQSDDIQIMTEESPHKEADEARRKSNQVLGQLRTMLQANPPFCAEPRRQEWLKEIQDLQEQTTPQTVFGVLGNTGVGKSSLLNALLEEAAVLPTSGSRGCTAAVVELVFHSGLLKADTVGDHENHPSMVPVYQGEVQFITWDDWLKELKILVEECSTAEKTVYIRVPEEDRAPTAAAAWQKIEQVYGKGYMEKFHKLPTHVAFHRLASNSRVKTLLTATNPGNEYNSLFVNIGEVAPGSDEAKELLKPFDQMKARTKRMKKQWAQDFRKEINSYVYRMGNGEEPQTWPLIRKVQLRGPWPVLSTGAVLVDLPGVRDSNAARAKVAERYLQNCNQIAIVAPIKRAVDDGTAKELLGEQFKRRLLMDGQYGNVFFICTQTDDLETTETMRDHADVAKMEPGRWERMSELAAYLTDLEKQLNDRLLEEEDLETQAQEAGEQYNDSKGDLEEVLKVDDDDDSDIEIDEELVQSLRAMVETNKSTYKQARQALRKFREANQHAMDRDQAKCSTMQKELKTLCAAVRNEYSKSCLQEDFRSGLKELYRKDDETDGDSKDNASVCLPEEFNMDVFCISSNDYLKIMKIKPSRDGPPSTFFNPADTQIPQLRAFVHETTSRRCKSHSKTFVENTKDLLDRIKLLAMDGSETATGKSAHRMKTNFETEMTNLDPKIHAIANNFKTVLDQKINQTLTKSIYIGAKRGSEEAMNTVHSWGSHNYRRAHERRPDMNGLFYATYNAVVRRSGVYTSSCAGEVDFNQELCDPMEKQFSTDWQSVLDSTIRRMLNEIERDVLELCADVSQRLACNFRASGLDGARLTSIVNTANRSAISALKVLFQQTAAVAVDAQRELSRTLLPAVQNQMEPTYQAVLHVEGGSGKFMRMKDAMAGNAQCVVNRVFDDAMKNLLAGIQAVIQRLHTMIASAAVVIYNTMKNVFSICWDDHQSGTSNMVDLEMLKKIRSCRDALLPELNRLCNIQAGASELLGIECEEMELDLMAVETFDQSIERRLEEAKTKGELIDLCDSDSDDSFLAAPPIFAIKHKVKKEEFSL